MHHQRIVELLVLHVLKLRPLSKSHIDRVFPGSKERQIEREIRDSRLTGLHSNWCALGGAAGILAENHLPEPVFEFESDQPEFAGEMRTTWSLVDKDGGTEVTVFMENIPTGIRLEDNELGSRQSLQKLAAYVEKSETS